MKKLHKHISNNNFYNKKIIIIELKDEEKLGNLFSHKMARKSSVFSLEAYKIAVKEIVI